MRYDKTLVVAISLIFSTLAFAVFEAPAPDAASVAMGGIPPKIGPGGMSLFGEPGISAGGGYRRSFNYSDFDEFAAWASCMKSSIGRIVLSADFFGVTDLSSETNLALGYSRSLFSDIHTGLSIAAMGNLHSLSYGKSIEETELGSAVGASFDLAAEAVVYRRTEIRILVENLTATNMGIEGDIEIPRAVTALIAYSPYSATNIAFHIRREAARDFTYGLGISASPHEIVTCRLGAATNPDRISGGIGLKYRFIVFDYTISSHPVLPLSHTVGFGVNFAE